MVNFAHIKSQISVLEKHLEDEHGLVSEAIGDIITIARLNDWEAARRLISEQYVVINRQDFDEEQYI